MWCLNFFQCVLSCRHAALKGASVFSSRKFCFIWTPWVLILRDSAGRLILVLFVGIFVLLGESFSFGILHYKWIMWKLPPMLSASQPTPFLSLHGPALRPIHEVTKCIQWAPAVPYLLSGKSCIPPTSIWPWLWPTIIPHGVRKGVTFPHGEA